MQKFVTLFPFSLIRSTMSLVTFGKRKDTIHLLADQQEKEDAQFSKLKGRESDLFSRSMEQINKQKARVTEAWTPKAGRAFTRGPELYAMHEEISTKKKNKLEEDVKKHKELADSPGAQEAGFFKGKPRVQASDRLYQHGLEWYKSRGYRK